MQDEGVKAHSALCRTKLADWGVVFTLPAAQVGALGHRPTGLRRLRPSRRCRRASALNPVGCRNLLPGRNQRLAARRAVGTRSVSTVDWPTGRAIHSRHHGRRWRSGFDGSAEPLPSPVSLSRISADPALQLADAASLARPGPRLRAPSAGCRRRPLLWIIRSTKRLGCTVVSALREGDGQQDPSGLLPRRARYRPLDWRPWRVSGWPKYPAARARWPCLGIRKESGNDPR